MSDSYISSYVLSGSDFMRRFRLLILLAWFGPPMVGMSFLLLIDMFSLAQISSLLATPLQIVFLLGGLWFSQWYFSRFIRPVEAYLDRGSQADGELSFARVRAFPLHFWSLFLLYLLLAPALVIVSAEMSTGFIASGVDWFRIHLVALIVSIIVGLPIFFSVFDLFGRAMSHLRQ